MSDILKSIGGFILMIGFFIIGIFIILGFINGSTWLGTKILPLLSVVVCIVFAIDILIILPLGLIRKARGISGVGLFISSYIYGIFLWFWTLLITYFTWGFIAVFIGIFVVGIGCVPIAIVASLVKGGWAVFGQILILIVFTYGTRTLGILFCNQADEMAWENNIEG